MTNTVPRLLTVDDIYHPDREIDFDDRHRRQWRWTDWGALVGIPSPKATDRTALVVDPRTGQRETLYDLDFIARGVDRVSGTNGQGDVSVHLLNTPERALVIRDDLVFSYDLRTREILPLINGIDPKPGVTPCPDATRAAVVMGNDLHVLDLASGEHRKVAGQGSETVLTGRLDWVYQEEIYGRGVWSAAWWSPDGAVRKLHVPYTRRFVN